jgi:phage terminase large subunit-like protein
MHLTKLEHLYTYCKALPHYHFRNLTDEEFDAKALKSISKLPDQQRIKVLAAWAKKAGKPASQISQEEFLQIARYRFLAQTNLFFLCNVLESYGQITLNTHEDICNDFFVQKDPTYITFDQFADQYTDLKNRMLLVPRGGFKSSLNMADCVQWIICYPAITIAILTGVLKLAKDFVGEVKKHFTYTETGNFDKNGKPIYGIKQIMDKTTGEWSDSFFQILFPEHCLSPNDDGNQLEFQTPAADEAKEPSVRATSIDQALSGSHYNVLKLDDVVTNENTKTDTRIKDTNKQISIDNGLLNPNGFYDVIGTWYDERDYYGVTIKKEEKFAKQDGMLESIKGSVDSGKFNSNISFKVYLRAAWWPKKESEGKIEEEMVKSDWELWFPERLTYEFLKAKQREDSDADDEDGDTGYFAIKYLNNPRKINRIKFPRDLLVRRTISHNQFPPSGMCVTTVDTAYSTKQWADYTVIMTALIFGGRFYIVNMTRGRYNEDDLPKVIAQVGQRWKPKRIAIEESVGVKWFSKELRREMDRLQISIPVEYVSLGHGSKLRSKQMKAKPVLRLLGDERLYFLNSCEGLDEIYNELEKFTGTADDKHDDIVSAISLLVEQFGSYADMDSHANSVNQDYVANKQAYDRHQQVYCLGKYARFNELGIVEENPSTNYAINQGAGNLMVDEPYNDPFADLTR